MHEHKLCPVCKESKCDEYFTRIIKRKDYNIDCDDDGYSYYLKVTLICLDCRLKLREKNK